MSLNNLGIVAVNQGDYPAARALHEESLAIRRELGDQSGIATSLNNLGYWPTIRATIRPPRHCTRRAWRSVGNWGIGRASPTSLNNLGNVAFEQGDYPAARALFEESLAIHRELGDRLGIASLAEQPGERGPQPGRLSGRPGTATRRAWRSVGNWGIGSGIPYSLEGLAAVVAALRDSLRAARIWGATERLRAEIGTPLPPNERSDYDRRVAAARIASGDDAAFDRAWQEGRGLTLDQAIDLALAGSHPVGTPT